MIHWIVVTLVNLFLSVSAGTCAYLNLSCTMPAVEVLSTLGQSLPPVQTPASTSSPEISRNAAQQPSAALRAKSFNAAEILAKAARGPVRIVVQIKRPTTPGYGTLGTNQEDIQAVARDNEAAQDAVIATYFGTPESLTGPGRALLRMPISPTFAINASLPEIEQLANDDRVLTIELDVLGRPPTVNDK